MEQGGGSSYKRLLVNGVSYSGTAVLCEEVYEIAGSHTDAYVSWNALECPGMLL